MSNPQITTDNEEEDDWETADLTIAPLKKLRPTAPTFQPKPPAQASTSNINSNSNSMGGGQRVHAPPGGQWNVDKRAQRSDWETKKAANANAGGGDGDDWFGEGRGQSNRQLWDEANSNPAPPQITFSQTQQLPGPQIKILRRQAPSNSTSEKAEGTTQGYGKTYAEKEEEYRLARERIFGGSSASTGTSTSTGSGGVSPIGGEKKSGRRSGSKSTSPAPSPALNSNGRTPPISRNRTPDSARSGTLPGGGGVVRQPRGPGDGGGFASGGAGLGAGGMMNGSNGIGQFPPGW